MNDPRVNSRGELYKEADLRAKAFKYLTVTVGLEKCNRVRFARELKEMEYIWKNDIEAFNRLIDGFS